jgi:hypothetical protein
MQNKNREHYEQGLHYQDTHDRGGGKRSSFSPIKAIFNLIFFVIFLFIAMYAYRIFTNTFSSEFSGFNASVGISGSSQGFGSQATQTPGNAGTAQSSSSTFAESIKNWIDFLKNLFINNGLHAHADQPSGLRANLARGIFDSESIPLSLSA